MRRLMVGLLLLLSGCDYTVPLVQTPDMNMDPALCGLWQSTDEEKDANRLLVLPLDEREYLVSYPAGKTDAMFARAGLCRCGDQTFIQLKWIGTARGALPENNRVYQYVTGSVTDDTLTVRLLNSDTVSKDLATTEALAAAIVEHAGSPELFRKDMRFLKIQP